jgi:hypothetical protein
MAKHPPQLELFQAADYLNKPDALIPMWDRICKGVNNNSCTHRAHVFTPKEIFDAMGWRDMNKNQPFTVNGVDTMFNSRRMQVFKKDICCVKCGKEAHVAFHERHINDAVTPYHINFYHVTESGQLVLMNMDHILPDSLGGNSELINLQTTCCKCNSNKSHIMTLDEIDMVLANPSVYLKPEISSDYLEYVLELMTDYILFSQAAAGQPDYKDERHERLTALNGSLKQLRPKKCPKVPVVKIKEYDEHIRRLNQQHQEATQWAINSFATFCKTAMVALFRTSPKQSPSPAPMPHYFP